MSDPKPKPTPSPIPLPFPNPPVSPRNPPPNPFSPQLSQQNNTMDWFVCATLKIPTFWSSRPDLWFLQVETQFRLKGISTDQTKYDYLISSLPVETMEIVADVIQNPTERDKYKNLKEVLISRCKDTEERRLDNLVNRVELGDSKPSELFRQMDALAQSNSLVNNSLLKKLWINKLPDHIKPTIVALETSQTQEQLFEIADKIYDTTDRGRIFSIESVGNDRKDDLVSMLSKLNKRIDEMEIRHSRDRYRNTSHNSNRSFSNSQSRSRNFGNSNKSKFCYYHSRYGNRARNCKPPCGFKTKPKQDNSVASKN